MVLVRPRLHLCANLHEQLPVVAKLEHLVAAHVSHPDVAVVVEGDHVGHVKAAGAPAAEHLAC